MELAGGLAGEPRGDVDPALAEHRLHLGQRGLLLHLADEPGADVVAASVVEVAGTLGGQQQPQPGRPGPAEQVLHRLLARGLPDGGEVEVGLVEHEHGLERPVRRRRPADPPADLHEELGDPELHVLVVPEELRADDAQPRLAGGRVGAKAEQGLDLQRLALGLEEIAVVQPERLQVLDEPVEELDVEPADLVDEAGVLLVDELDQGLDEDRGPGGTPG